MSPLTARVDLVRETRFGITMDDPYRWMENPADTDLDRWLDGQADHCREALEALPHPIGWRVRIQLPAGYDGSIRTSTRVVRGRHGRGRAPGRV